jgi:hypothetical protein
MQTFIKVIEIWTPSADRRQLQLAEHLCVDKLNFSRNSQIKVINYNEGLPGKAWSRAYPQIITDLKDSYFLRKLDAIEANLTAGIAFPIFSGEFLLAVVVFLCGDREYDAGAIELWGNDQEETEKLQLVDGYYGSLNVLEHFSRRMSFVKGEGLPGTVWDYNLPIVIDEPANSPIFLRRGSAENDGISMAFGLPYNYQHNNLVLTFLSSMDTPIAKRFEIWVPDRNHTHLFFHGGKCELGQDLKACYQDKKIQRGENLLGQVWLSGSPQISYDLQNNGLIDTDYAEKLDCSIMLPMIDDGLLRSIVVLYF